MKKIISALMCMGILAAALTGCGYNDALENSNKKATQATESTQAENAPVVKDSDYKDSLAGLADYLADKGYIEKKKDKETQKEVIDDSKVTKMDAKLIGAKEGNKYLVGKNIYIEIYAYDTANLDNTAKDVISSVKTDGKFEILDLPAVEAFLSDNGKYLMVYTDITIKKDNPDTTAQNYVIRQECVEDFKAFHAE